MRYPTGPNKAWFPSIVEVVTVVRDAYGQVSGTPTVTATIAAKVSERTLETYDTVHGVAENKIKIMRSAIKATVPPTDAALAIDIGTVLRYGGKLYEVVERNAPTDFAGRTTYVVLDAYRKKGE